MAEPVILQHLQKVKRNGAGWTALCPGHDDKARSLSVTEADDRTLIHCFVGCTAEQIVKAAGLEWSDMFASPNGATPQKRSEWQIKNLAGEIVATHIRLDPGKVIWWERNGEHGLDGFPISSMPLYRTETLARLPIAQPLIITEGEKAADALLRFQVHAFATFGATSQPDDETLKPFAGRPVTLWPDNDNPGRSHMLKLGESLERVGARVKVVEWPDAPPKGDAYDFATAGATGAARDSLIALLATSRPLAEFGWDAVSLNIPTTEGVIEPPPTIERTDAGCRVIWDTGLATDYMALIERVVRRSDELRCLIETSKRFPGQPWEPLTARIHIDLYSASQKDGLRRNLNARTKGEWSGRVEQLTKAAEQLAATFEPPIALADVVDPGATEWLVQPIIERGEHTVLFGTGGSGKSLISLAISILVAAETMALPGMVRMGCHACLYLDWETGGPTHRLRMAQIVRGSGAIMPRNLHYLRMGPRMVDAIEPVRDFVKAHGVGMVVIDSLGMACGGNLNEDAVAIGYNEAIRQLQLVGATVLSVAHLPKDKERQETPIGSVYFHNGARATWKITATQEPGESSTEIVIVQKKANNSGFARPLGMRFEFTSATCRFYRQDARESPTLSQELSNPQRILYVLEGGDRTTKEVAQESGIKEAVCKATLYRMLHQGKVSRQGEEWHARNALLGVTSNVTGMGSVDAVTPLSKREGVTTAGVTPPLEPQTLNQDQDATKESEPW